VPPNAVAPVPTVKVFVPVTDVAPLRLTEPVPVENVPAPVCDTFPEVVIPVAPETAPPEESLKVGVLIKFVKPVPDSKVMPLIILVLLLVAAAKSMPLRILVLLVLVAFVKFTVSPLTVVPVTEVLLFVTPNT